MERIDVDLATTAPHPALRRFVRYYSQRRIVPGDDLQEPVTARLGGLLEFHFASLYRIPIVGTDRFESCAPMLVVGPITYRRLHLTANGTVESLTVMFQPFGLYELFGVPTNLLTEHAVEAHSLLGRSISQLYATLGEARTFPTRVRLLDQFLLKRLSSRNRMRNSHWTQSLTFVAQDRGTHTVRELAASLNTSPRQLERRSLELAGMTPQTMARVARFVHALRLKRAANDKRVTWTEIAHASGYYDQMHLIRDFRLMGGATPTALTRQLQSHHGTSLLVRPSAQNSGVSEPSDNQRVSRQ
jgi:AraC-like DNA-binding protein